jgi:hypothetical protein
LKLTIVLGFLNSETFRIKNGVAATAGRSEMGRGPEPAPFLVRYRLADLSTSTIGSGSGHFQPNP